MPANLLNKSFMKFLLHIVAIAVLSYAWLNYFQNKEDVAAQRALAKTVGNTDLRSDQLPEYLKKSKDPAEKKALEELIKYLKNAEKDVDETVIAAQNLADDKDSISTFTGILYTFLSAGYIGIVFVAYILPLLAHRATHTIYDSGEILQKDNMSLARSKLAQGDYEGAMLAFREAAVGDPDNRIPWVEIIKIQREFLHDPAAAIATIREILEVNAWHENDAAYFLFRLAELYDTDMGDRESAVAIMEQVLEQFPETRHSANARHKLHEWGLV
jgi:tetratricopeptide (TPR) repeat protein